MVRAFEVLGRHFSYFDIANSIYNSLNPVKSCNFPKAKMIEVSWWYIVYYKKPSVDSESAGIVSQDILEIFWDILAGEKNIHGDG